jgi:hypothetical protein
MVKTEINWIAVGLRMIDGERKGVELHYAFLSVLSGKSHRFKWNCCF